jgi:signal transduction histidine kinase
LVTKNYIALAELVKNAYDADATTITLKFTNVTQHGDTREKSGIKIVDNGAGMNFRQIKEFWMRIATPNKLREMTTLNYGRKKAGSKGIGRFACARIASKLILESTAKREEDDRLDHTIVTFDWDKYEPGTTLTEIPNSYSRTILTEGSTGTILRLIGLRDQWTEADFNILRRQILGLSIATTARRKGFKEDPGFSIILDAPGFEKGFGALSEQLMDSGWGRLKGWVSQDGTATLQLEAMEIGTVKFEFTERFANIPGTHFDVAIIWNRKDYCRDKSTLALYSVNEIFENWSGVKVFLDGFRVYPYGDPGDDWLGIDRRQARRLGKTDPIFQIICNSLVGVDESRALLNQPRNQNLVGKVFVTNQFEPVFEVLINREGFVESAAVNRLRNFFLKALDWTTIYYNHFLYIYRDRKLTEAVRDFQKLSVSKEPLEKSEEETPKVIDSAITVIENVYEDYAKNVKPEQRKTITKHAKAALDLIEETVLHMNKQITALRTVASAGALLLVLSHETRDIINMLGTMANSLKLLSETVDKHEKGELAKFSNSIRETRDRLSDQMALFNGVSANIRNMEKRRINLCRLAEEVVGCFRGLCEEFSISPPTIDIPTSLSTGLMLKGEVYSILINLVSNAVKATIAGHGKSIKIEAFKGESEIVMRIYDDGIGLSRESRDLVLRTGVPDPENILYKELAKRLGYAESLTVGEGSGLGLSIVREILAAHDKSIQFVDVAVPWKTCVEVTLPS